METKLTGSFWKLKKLIGWGGKVSNGNDEGGVSD